MKHKPLILTILDGWGYSKNPEHNAILTAKTPTWDHLWTNYPHTFIDSSGQSVGLPDQQMGNSEVGHMNLGMGRVVYQELTRINKAIADETFFQNSVLTTLCDNVIEQKSALHILGLCSPGGIHSHEDHIQAMIELAVEKGVEHIYLHAFLDGRDTPPKSAKATINKFQVLSKKYPQFKLASLIGRYYAMDRDKRWDRIEAAYRLLTQGQATFLAPTAEQALEKAYSAGLTDEFVKPCSIQDDTQSAITIQDNDAVIFMNFRADRARELTHALIDINFSGFKRERCPKLCTFVSLTQYDKNFAITAAFPPISLKNGLGEFLAKHHYKQLRIAETEKYAHVTFFFNGGVEVPYPNEQRTLIPSPKVATYDLQPEMSAVAITDEIVKTIKTQKVDVIICNYANPDMVGHTGNFEATVKAIETIDQCLSNIINALNESGGELLITADHGNAECMFDEKTGQAHTAHTKDPVPLIYFGRPASFKEQGILADIAPTMLYLLNEKKPIEMTGQSLLKLKE